METPTVRYDFLGLAGTRPRSGLRLRTLVVTQDRLALLRGHEPLVELTRPEVGSVDIDRQRRRLAAPLLARRPVFVRVRRPDGSVPFFVIVGSRGRGRLLEHLEELGWPVHANELSKSQFISVAFHPFR